jgi:alkylated DNA repair dioxygenase AlkB
MAPGPDAELRQPLLLTPEHTAPDGFVYVPEFLTTAEQDRLVAAVEAMPFREVRMHGVVAKRQTAHFGWDYGYESWRVTRAAPIPAGFAEVRARCAAAAGLDPGVFEALLVSRYPSGAGIGWHRDAPMFGDVVAGVSLGAPCVLRFRRGKVRARETLAVTVSPGSLYLLSGAARREWQHCIRPVDTLRYSLTFRTLR